MTQENPSPCYPDLPWAMKLASRSVADFEDAIDLALEDYVTDDELLDDLEDQGRELRSAVEASIGDAYYWGVAAAFGLMGMAFAIAENDRVRGCPHCGVAPTAWAYCDCVMCDVENCGCLYRICKVCLDAGKNFDARAAQRMSSTAKETTDK